MLLTLSLAACSLHPPHNFLHLWPPPSLPTWQRQLPLLERDHLLMLFLPKFSFLLLPNYLKESLTFLESIFSSCFLLEPLKTGFCPHWATTTILIESHKGPSHHHPGLCSEFILLGIPDKGWVNLSGLPFHHTTPLCPVSYLLLLLLTLTQQLQPSVPSPADALLATACIPHPQQSHLWEDFQPSPDPNTESLASSKLPSGYSHTESLEIVWYVETGWVFYTNSCWALGKRSSTSPS